MTIYSVTGRSHESEARYVYFITMEAYVYALITPLDSVRESSFNLLI